MGNCHPDLHHHELPHGVRLQGPAWWQPGDAIARPLSHEEIGHVSRPGRPSCCTRRRRAQRQWYEMPQNPRQPHRARLVPRHDGPVEDRTAMEHAAVHVRSPAPVPRDVRRDQPEHPVPLEMERATSTAARQEECALTRRHDTAEQAHHAGVRRPVPQRGDDQGPGARMARRRGTRRPSQPELGSSGSCVACA